MCGIAGYFGKKKIPQDSITRTLCLMKRRGPDFQAHEQIQITNDKNCVFLHSRLKIIDLEARSNQPFRYKNKINAEN